MIKFFAHAAKKTLRAQKKSNSFYNPLNGTALRPRPANIKRKIPVSLVLKEMVVIIPVISDFVNLICIPYFLFDFHQ